MHDQNEVHVLEYREDSNQIDVAAIFPLPDHKSLWALDSSPIDPALIITCDQSKEHSKYNVNIWKMVRHIEPVCSFHAILLTFL